MIIRQITLNTEPTQSIQLYYDSRSNAEKPAEDVGISCCRFTDDYKQRFSCRTDLVASDMLIDIKEQGRAIGEIEIAKVMAELKFNERVDADPVVKTQLSKKMAAKAGGMPQMSMPPSGGQ